MGSYVSCLYEKEWYDGINEEVSVEENNVLVKFLHAIDPSVYLHWPAIDVKCYVPVNHVLQLLSIPTVKTSGRPCTFLKSEFKNTKKKQFTKNLWTWKHSLMHLPIKICSSTSSNLTIIGNFWKHLTLIHIKAFSFVLYTVIPGYFNEFIYEIMKWNTSKIKHHRYEALNLQVYFIVLLLTYENL